jgi:hypothetical protein
MKNTDITKLARDGVAIEAITKGFSHWQEQVANGSLPRGRTYDLAIMVLTQLRHSGLRLTFKPGHKEEK